MSFSLDTPSIQTLKSEARALRETRAAAGTPLPHAAALEQVARAHGYRDWNTARASLPEQQVTPFQVGGRVQGTYLEQPFTGVLIGETIGWHAVLALAVILTGVWLARKRAADPAR